jgi:hypothetical protein
MCKPRPIAQQTLAELVVTAAEWNKQRMYRALNEWINWKMLPDGTLVHKNEDKMYHCAEVVRVDGQPVAYIDCDCDDNQTHVKRLHAFIKRNGGKPQVCLCKHHWIRMFLAGHSVRVPGIGTITVKPQYRK